MNSYQLYHYKESELGGEESSEGSEGSRGKVQNCSILDIQVLLGLEEQGEEYGGGTGFGFQEIQQLNFNQLSSHHRQYKQKRVIAIGNQYLNLKTWEENRKKQKDNRVIESPAEKSNRSERKRLLGEMIEKLNTNQRSIKEGEVDDSIISKIQNIVGLLGEVEKEIKIKQKCSLGMKLKLKVDPNQRYFKRKDNQKDPFYYTAREKNMEGKGTGSTKCKQPLNKGRLHYDLIDKPLEFKQRQEFEERQYGTQNLYSTSLSQKRSKGQFLPCERDRERERERNSVEHTTNLIKQRREEIVEKEMKRREKWYNRLIHKE